MLSFITCKRKSAVNCLPIAYHPLLVTLCPSLSPSPTNLSRLSFLSSFTHGSLWSTAERHQLTFNTFISVCLKTGLPARPSASPSLTIATCYYSHVCFGWPPHDPVISSPLSAQFGYMSKCMNTFTLKNLLLELNLE